jgi:hypothetical protein
LHARRALKGFRKFKQQDQAKACLDLLITLCEVDGNDDDRDAYVIMLERLGVTTEERVTVTPDDRGRGGLVSLEANETSMAIPDVAAVVALEEQVAPKGTVHPTQGPVVLAGDSEHQSNLETHESNPDDRPNAKHGTASEEGEQPSTTSNSNTSANTTIAEVRVAQDTGTFLPQLIQRSKDPQYIAIYDFVGQTNGELHLKAGEKISIEQKSPNGSLTHLHFSGPLVTFV